jgi:WS/DGAT/MGAT family acyltransferase
MDPEDAAFLYDEDRNVQLGVGLLCLVDGPIDFDALRATILARTVRFRRFREVVVAPSLGLGVPSWREDARFDVGSHLRRIAVAPPGGEIELFEAASQAWSQAVERSRPLWDATLLDGVSGGRAALLVRAHRCMLDPAEALRLADLFADRFEKPRQAGLEGVPAEESGLVAGAVRVLGDVVGFGIAAGDLLRALAPASAWGSVRSLARAAEAVSTLLSTPAPETPLNGALGAARHVGWVRLSHEVLGAIESSLGGTRSDCFLTIVASALGKVLGSRGRSTTGLELVAIVPPCEASKRARTGDASLGGRGWSAAHVLAALPVGPLSPRERHRAVRASRQDSKLAGRLAGMEFLSQWTTSLPAALQRTLKSLAFQAVNTICIEAEGTDVPLRAVGRAVEVLAPIAPLMRNIGVTFTMLPYARREVGIGINADPTYLPDLTPLRSALLDAYVELAASAGVPAIDPARARA